MSAANIIAAKLAAAPPQDLADVDVIRKAAEIRALSNSPARVREIGESTEFLILERAFAGSSVTHSIEYALNGAPFGSPRGRVNESF
jgi:hypothetical protein